jgi:hypothetical protein
MATAAPVVAATQRPALRLGFQAASSDAIALVGLRNGYFQASLGTGVILTPMAYPSASAEADALTSGRLDAAYLSPLAAVQAWQATRGAVRIVAGAALNGTDTITVLAVTARLLDSGHAAVRDLLQGQVQAEDLVATDLTAAQPAVQAELSSLGVRVSARQVASALSPFRFTDNPDASSIAAQAQQAGLTTPATSLAGLYQLAPLDDLLRASGQVPFTG